MTTSIEQARLTKPKVRATVEACGTVVGIGLTKIGDSYAVKVNMREQVRQPDALPESIDGVRIVYEVVGSVSLRSDAS